jgi:hypothetical protein
MFVGRKPSFNERSAAIRENMIAIIHEGWERHGKRTQPKNKRSEKKYAL